MTAFVALRRYVELYNMGIINLDHAHRDEYLADLTDTVAQLHDAVEAIPYHNVNSKITDWKTGKTVFEKLDVKVPQHWSQIAVDVLAQKYMRKAGVPQTTQSAHVTQSRFRSHYVPTDSAVFGGENSARQVFHRIAGCWTHWGLVAKYFDVAGGDTAIEDMLAEGFYAANVYVLAMQLGAPNSPQWFNTGVHWAYGITAPLNGGFYWDPAANELRQTNTSYERPQPHACFIQGIRDTLVNEGGIMDLWWREAQVFKFGSGSGTNFSALRAEGERLSSGGKSSGLMSFLKVGDSSAGSIKSGGTTRRAAKMVSLNIDHPELMSLVAWKTREENKVAALVAGSHLNKHHIDAILETTGDAQLDAIADALDAGVPEPLVARATQAAVEQVDLHLEEFDLDWQSEAYATVSGQNANISVGVFDRFMDALENDALWEFTGRKDITVNFTLPAKDVWTEIIVNAWCSADPGIQWLDTMNAMNTVPNSGTIEATNPCSEYVFLNDTACNLASQNLVQLRSLDDDTHYAENLETLSRLWTIALDISVEMAQFPSAAMAENSYKFRTLGQGYANLGSLVMRLGLRYGSDEACDLTELITSHMTSAAYHQSALLAKLLGPFAHFELNRTPMLAVMQKHAEHRANFNKLVAFGTPQFAQFGFDTQNDWERVYQDGTSYGFRNAQVTVLAPTGTIGLVMDCDTTGIEPDFSLVKYKSLAGGGNIKIVNAGMAEALGVMGVGTNAQNFVIEAMLEGTPVEQLGEYLSDEQIAVFDCAVSANGGTRQLHYMDHLHMMEAAQRYLSGGISKTVNLPSTATVADVDAVYRASHTMGIKAIALYRDGSKLSQPLMTAQLAEVKRRVRTPVEALKVEAVQQVLEERGVVRRRRLPGKRNGYTQRAVIAGHKLYHHTGEYPDGTLGEIYVDVAKEGATLRALCNNFAIAVSIGLQYGVPLEEYVEAFVFSKFEPAGMVQGHDNIKKTDSLVDYLFRDLAVHYLGRDDLANIPPVRVEEDNSILVPSGVVERDLTHLVPSDKATFVSMGYTGDICSNCGSFKMNRTGTCMTCESCGTTTGC